VKKTGEKMSAQRQSEFKVEPLFINRWSPRAFTGEAIDDATLFSLFEAARWAPSANNAQPWRFIYAKNNTPEWPVLFSLLNEKNQVWAAKAGALVILVSKKVHYRQGETQPSPFRTHSLDSGAAWASLAFQAIYSGLRTRAIGGFDREKAREVLKIPQDYNVEVAIAIGKQAEASSLNDELREREQPNQRKPLSALVAKGSFAFAE
jgi:nitroreductase